VHDGRLGHAAGGLEEIVRGRPRGVEVVEEWPRAIVARLRGGCHDRRGFRLHQGRARRRVADIGRVASRAGLREPLLIQRVSPCGTKRRRAGCCRRVDSVAELARELRADFGPMSPDVPVNEVILLCK